MRTSFRKSEMDMFETNWETILKAIGNVELEEDEERYLRWLAKNDYDTVNSICSVITKIKNRNAGRKPKVDRDKIQTLKAQGKTQEWIAQHMTVSISTIKRYWK